MWISAHSCAGRVPRGWASRGFLLIPARSGCPTWMAAPATPLYIPYGFLLIPARYESHVDFCSFLRSGHFPCQTPYQVTPMWISAHSCARDVPRGFLLIRARRPGTPARAGMSKNPYADPRKTFSDSAHKKTTTLLCYLARQQMSLTSGIFTARSKNPNSTNRAQKICEKCAIRRSSFAS